MKQKKMKIKLPKKINTQFVLLGAGYDLCKIADLIIDNDFKKPIIVTHPKKFHKRDNRLLEKHGHHIDVFSYAKNNGLKIFEADNLEDDALLNQLKKYGSNVTFSHACRTIIKQKFLDFFGNLVFNIHPSLLPEERGAATFTWRILNDQKFITATIHQIDTGIDSGPILFQKKLLIKKRNTTPLDYDILTSHIYELIFRRFLKLFELEKMLKLKKQDDLKSTYFSRLYTEINGAINFDWSNQEIEKFVRAFSYPYTGAFTFVNKQRISILECEIEHSKIKFHPFSFGRVNKIFEDGTVRIITKGGYLRIKRIQVRKKDLIPSKIIRINDVLYTPKDILDESRNQTINVRKMK